MHRVCPKPSIWNDVYKRLRQVAATRPDLDEPPVPLILAGWAYSNDVEKMDRWQRTIQWAKAAGCEEIVASLNPEDFRCVKVLTAYEVGPLYGPMYRPWDFERKERPTDAEIEEALQKLNSQWLSIAGSFAADTKPLCFSGDKARQLLVGVLGDARPPWGHWNKRSSVEEERRTFTTFRRAVNDAIKPMEVDHIVFVKD
jgi:hypothetical protein